MKTLHTPGPWNSLTGHDWDGATVRDSLGRITAVCDGCNIPGSVGEVRTEEAVANARLISAAPELLTALEAMLPLQDWTVGQSSRDALQLARSAIAKARGVATPASA